MIFSWTMAIGYIVIAPFLGGLFDGIDRKISAKMQGRIGPPILQPFYDVSKLFQKETKMVNHLQQFMISGFLIFAVFTGALFFWGGDLLLVFFALTLAGIFYVMSASVANAPYSSIAAQRELMQMMTYEPMILLTAIGFYIATGSFSVKEISHATFPNVIILPGFFLGFIYILTIKLRKSPFDISTGQHAHQEIVQGLKSDLSGFVLALVEISHWYENVFLFGVISLFFVNIHRWSVWLALIVCILIFFLEVIIDSISARVRWQMMLKSVWLVTLVTGVVNLLIISIFNLSK